METDRQMDRQMDTYTNIKGGSDCTQLRFYVRVCACVCNFVVLMLVTPILYM